MLLIIIILILRFHFCFIIFAAAFHADVVIFIIDYFEFSADFSITMPF